MQTVRRAIPLEIINSTRHHKITMHVIVCSILETSDFLNEAPSVGTLTFLNLKPYMRQTTLIPNKLQPPSVQAALSDHRLSSALIELEPKSHTYSAQLEFEKLAKKYE